MRGSSVSARRYRVDLTVKSCHLALVGLGYELSTPQEFTRCTLTLRRWQTVSGDYMPICRTMNV